MLDQVTPSDGVYLHEANWKHHNGQTESYGTNYPKLLGVKHKYGPEALLSANKAVGSEAWTPDSQGQLLRTQSPREKSPVGRKLGVIRRRIDVQSSMADCFECFTLAAPYGNCNTVDIDNASILRANRARLFRLRFGQDKS